MGTCRLKYSLHVGHTEANLTPRFAEAGVEPISLIQLKPPYILCTLQGHLLFEKSPQGILLLSPKYYTVHGIPIKDTHTNLCMHIYIHTLLALFIPYV